MSCPAHAVALTLTSRLPANSMVPLLPWTQATFDGVSHGVFGTAEAAARCVDAHAVARFGRALAAARGVLNLP